MKALIAHVMTLTLATLSGCIIFTGTGCQVSPQGGSSVINEGQGFRIAVPTFDVVVNQGEVQTVIVSLQKGSFFKEDVKLAVKASKGISVEPASVTVKANDKPEVQLRITAPKDAAIGEYPVVVTGTPETGNATSIGFTVKVVAP